MTEALIIPFVIAQAIPAHMITGSISQLFSKSRGKWARGNNPIAAPADPCHA